MIKYTNMVLALIMFSCQGSTPAPKSAVKEKTEVKKEKTEEKTVDSRGITITKKNNSNRTISVSKGKNNLGSGVYVTKGSDNSNKSVSVKTVNTYKSNPKSKVDDNVDPENTTTPAATNETPSASIIIYGNKRCGHCRALKRRLKRAKLKYVFYDVTKDKSKAVEMWKKVKSIKPNAKRIKFPVVIANGKVLIRPSIRKVKKALK
jgi:glutaredoxin